MHMRKELEEIIKSTLTEFYANDDYLVDNHRDYDERYRHNNERSLVFRFGIYFDKLLKQSKFKDYQLDSEYNRNLNDEKRLEPTERGKFPDIILHKRGTNEFNLLMVEFKTWWDNDRIGDIGKIEKFVDNNREYKYEFGLSVIFEKSLQETIASFKWFPLKAI